jgi:hypothetical protein
MTIQNDTGHPSSKNPTATTMIDTFLGRSLRPANCEPKHSPPRLVIDLDPHAPYYRGFELAGGTSTTLGVQQLHLFADGVRLMGFVDLLLPEADAPWYIALDGGDTTQRQLLDAIGRKRKLQIATGAGLSLTMAISALRAEQWRLLRTTSLPAPTLSRPTLDSTDPILGPIFHQYGPFLLYLAYRGYEQLGRGIVLIRNLGTYYGANYSTPTAAAPTARAAASAYDPEREMVVLLDYGVEPIPLAVIQPASPELWPSRVVVRQDERPQHIKQHPQDPHWRLEKRRPTAAA